MDERETPFELIVQLIAFARSQNEKTGSDGSVLVFLTGWKIIVALFKALENHPVTGNDSFLILPMHSQVPKEEQYRCFQPAPPGVTKVILSTNICETSVRG